MATTTAPRTRSTAETDPHASAAVEMLGVHKWYGEFHVLRDINLHVRRGERIVIPGIVNNFISLFKDTTLVAIVGIFDLIRTIEASRVDPVWAAPTISYTGYAFAGIFYFLCCWGMSRYSISVERRLATGYKR